MMRLLALALLASLAVAHPALAKGLAYVLNSGEASVSVIDMQTLRELRAIPVLREPHHLVFTPDGKDILIGDSAANELVVIDSATGGLKRRIPVANPYHLAFSPDHRYLVVNGLARNQIDVYDAASMTLLKRFPIRSMPSHLAYSPDSSMVYVTLQGTDSMAAIDLRRLELMGVTEVGKTPAGVIWHNGKLLVANMGTDHFVVIDPATGVIERTIATGRGTHQIFPSPDGKYLWVNSRVDSAVTQVDARTLEIIRRYPLPGGPDCIDFAPDGKLWITRRFIERVAILDPVSGEINNVSVGRSPHGILLVPWANREASAAR